MYNTDRIVDPEGNVLRNVYDGTEHGKEWARSYDNKRRPSANYVRNMATNNGTKGWDFRNLWWNYVSIMSDNGPLTWDSFDSRLDNRPWL